MNTKPNNNANTPHVLRNMKEFLGDPQTCEDLYNTLTMKLTEDEIYDLHSEEKSEVWNINSSLRKALGLEYEMTDKEHFHKVNNIIMRRLKVQNYLRNLQKYYHINAFETNYEDMLGESYAAYAQGLQKIYGHCVQALALYEKKITADDIYTMDSKIIDRYRVVENIEDDSIAILLREVAKHIWANGTLNEALRVAADFAGEDISRPLMSKVGAESLLENGYDLRPNIAIMCYIYELISMEQFLEHIKKYRKKLNEDILRTLGNSLPTIQWMMHLSKKAQDIDTENALVQVDHKNLSVGNMKSINLDKLKENEIKSDALKVILDSPIEDVQRMLDLLKSFVNPAQSPEEQRKVYHKDINFLEE